MYLGKLFITAKRNVYALFRNKQKYNYTNYMQVKLMRLMSKIEYLIMPKVTKFMELGKLGLTNETITSKQVLLKWKKNVQV